MPVARVVESRKSLGESLLAPPPSQGTPFIPPFSLFHFLLQYALDLLLSYLLAAFVSHYLIPLSPLMFALVMCGGLLGLLALLPTFSHANLVLAEAKVLSSVKGLRHDWTALTTSGGVQWNIHSVCVKRSGGGGGAPLPTLVVLHGHSCGAGHWEVVPRELGEYTDVWVIDLPGWGRTPAPPQLLAAPSLATGSADAILGMHLEVLAAWLASKGLGGGGGGGGGVPCALLGHSLGGYIAASFAAAHPHTLSHLILSSPVGYLPMQPGGRTWRSSATFYCLPPQRAIRLCGRVAGGAMATLLRLVYPEDNPAFAPYYLQLAWATWVGGACDSVWSTLFQGRPGGKAVWSRPWLPLLLDPTRDTLRSKLPLTVMWGTEEELLPPQWATAMHRYRPLTDLYLIAGGKHNAAHSHPHAFCQALLHALRRRGSGGEGGGEGAATHPLPAICTFFSSPHHHHASTTTTTTTTTTTSSAITGVAAMGTGDAVLRHMTVAATAATAVAAAVGGAVSVSPPPPHQPLQSGEEGCTTPTNVSQLCSGAESPGSVSSSSGSSSDGSVGSLSRDGSRSSSRGVGGGESEGPPNGGEREGEGEGFTSTTSTSTTTTLSPASLTVTALTSPSGVGYCRGCACPVLFRKSYWQCGCGAWCFTNSFLDGDLGWGECRDMLAFMDELYLCHPVPFNARTSVHVGVERGVQARSVYSSSGSGSKEGAGAGAGPLLGYRPELLSGGEGVGVGVGVDLPSKPVFRCSAKGLPHFSPSPPPPEGRGGIFVFSSGGVTAAPQEVLYK